ncbi:potassium voltage-gated channel protein Shaw-like [Haliotis rubra]|uniref:potassium voltage-gated channel protein Shaw-like n=1 Tax=Haliotis rubra TaxID=36100 RepID=UPI001EE4FC3A|nr:potassium voltage-gated channel protein Shaw-like [Haliotis rubra]
MSGQAIEKCVINVAGKKFCIRRSLLQRFPTTRLATLSTSSEEYDSSTAEFYFDRNPSIMHCVLDLYRTGEFHIPSNMCTVAIRREMEFWGVPEDMVADCCWKSFSIYVHDKEVQKKIQEIFKEDIDLMYTKETSLKQVIWLTMENPDYSFVAKIWNIMYMIFISVAIIVFCLFNEPIFRVRTNQNNNGSITNNSAYDDTSTLGMLMNTLPNPYLYVIDNICLVFFTIEIVIRLTVCPNKPRFFKHPLNILDIFLIAVMWIVFIMDRFPEVTHDSSDIKRVETFLRLCFSLRIFRVLHFGKRSQTMKILILTFKSSARELSVLMIGLGMAVLIFATLVFTTEMVLMSHTFDSIHKALWWALITMTTVGYGDYVPKSVPGQVVGSISAIIGLLILSLPIAIIASNFNVYISNVSARELRKKQTPNASTDPDTPLPVVANPGEDPPLDTSHVTRLEVKEMDEHM